MTIPKIYFSCTCEIFIIKNKFMNSLPLVTVVTVCYNASALIESTIHSVLNQTYPNIEYIIIAGGSTDGTLNIIKKYQNRLSYWISERDNGIYDAMNKGIAVAHGQWINFMNAGDSFCDENVIENLFTHQISSKVRVFYGDTVCLLSDNRQSPVKALPVNQIKFGMIFCHQSVFVSLVNKEEVYFDTRYKLSADYNQVYSFFHKYGLECLCYKELPISLYEFENGLSAIYKIKCLRERFLIHIRFHLWLGCLVDCLMIILYKLGLK